MKKKINFIFGIILLSACVISYYHRWHSSEFINESLLERNVEALTSEESATDCDITHYNRNYMEGWVKTEVQYSRKMGLYIVVGGSKKKLGASFSAVAGETIFYSSCISSPGNCCKKSWAQNIQIKKP